MPDYQKGKIYTIRNYTDDTLIYVGSTTDTLSRRLATHRIDCKKRSSISLYSHIIENCWNGWYIELVENYPCNNNTELKRREGEIIRQIGTINKYIAGRTKKEYYKDNADNIKENKKEYRKENADKINELAKTYRNENADKIKEYQKEYRKENTDKINEYRKENADKINDNNKKWRNKNIDKVKEIEKLYRKENADKIKEIQKLYRKENANKIKERQSEKVCCNICGSFVRKDYLTKHKKNIKCTNAFNLKID